MGFRFNIMHLLSEFFFPLLSVFCLPSEVTPRRDEGGASVI
jgi:hypothetical protein